MSAQLNPRIECVWVGREFAQKGLDDVWPMLREAVEVYGDGKFSKAGILEQLEDGSAILWLTLINGVPSAAVVTWIDQYEQERRMVMGFAGGYLNSLTQLYPIIEENAHKNKCTAIECWGRKGWEKVGKNYGYEYIHTVVRKQL